MKQQKAIDAINALEEKYPEGVPDIDSLSPEQKAWLQLQILLLTDDDGYRRIGIKLQQIRNRLLHATEDIPDKELKEILRFIFKNLDTIKRYRETDGI